MRTNMAAIGGILFAAVALLAIFPARARADLDSAKKMFGELCARCHGPDGHGDGPDGGPLATKPRNFHDCALMAKEADETMFQEIKGGSNSIGRSNDMPAWGESLSDEEIRDLVLFLRTFCQHQ
jgi:mono/diheme cytochrome c family protein